LLDSIYAQAMRIRRRWFEERPASRRRLAHPVLSVGNLSMGGTGKTPVVGAIVERLLTRGERPAILSRGYARTDAPDGVVVVSDGTRVLASLDRSGDEPLMLARRWPGAIVCVSPDRYLSGVLAERQLGATVHVLDDGFQHVALERQLDVLVTTAGEIPHGRVIPRGRLRESMDAAARAHVLVVNGANAGAASAEAWTLGISQSCGLNRALAEPVALNAGSTRAVTRDARVLAVAGIAHPARFGDALKDAGWQVAGMLEFPDHHQYSSADIEKIERERVAAAADAVFTTDKDAVRFDAIATPPFAVYRVPLTVAFDPPEALFAAVEAALRVGAPA
jgi:tetraacyldisaccharide 4'-kinase